MKKLVTVIVVLCFAVCTAFADTGKVEKLQSEIQQLNKQISELKKTVELQKAEITRLKTLCQRNGIDLSPKKRSEKPTQSAIGQPMFGVFLGETLDSLKKRFRVSQSTFTFENEDHPGKIWNVQNNNANVKQLLIYTFDNNIYTIDIRFRDGSRSNYEAIKSQLEKKYKSEDKGGISGAMFGEGVFEPVIDGVEVKIKLNHDTGFMEDDKLDLSYTHTPLSQKVYEEIQRRKASKIGSEL